MAPFKRPLIVGVLLPIAFVGSCTALTLPAWRLAEPLTHRSINEWDAGPFPILLVRGDEPRLLILEDAHVIPPLAAGETYLVPAEKETAFQKYLHEHGPHGRDWAWVLDVDRLAPGRQRIELYLIGDGYDGGAYEATARAITPLYRKIAGPGFAFIAAACALAMNTALWGALVVAVAFIRRKRAA